MKRLVAVFRRWRRMRRTRSIRSNHLGGSMPIWAEQENDHG